MYRVGTPGVLGDGLDLDNEPQPDVCLLIDPVRGGQARKDGDGYINIQKGVVKSVGPKTISDLRETLMIQGGRHDRSDSSGRQT